MIRRAVKRVSHLKEKCKDIMKQNNSISEGKEPEGNIIPPSSLHRGPCPVLPSFTRMSSGVQCIPERPHPNKPQDDEPILPADPGDVPNAARRRFP